MQKLDDMREKISVTNELFLAARKRAHKAKLAFGKVLHALTHERLICALFLCDVNH